MRTVSYLPAMPVKASCRLVTRCGIFTYCLAITWYPPTSSGKPRFSKMLIKNRVLSSSTDKITRSLFGITHIMSFSTGYSLSAYYYRGHRHFRKYFIKFSFSSHLHLIPTLLCLHKPFFDMRNSNKLVNE